MVNFILAKTMNVDVDALKREGHGLLEESEYCSITYVHTFNVDLVCA